MPLATNNLRSTELGMIYWRSLNDRSTGITEQIVEEKWNAFKSIVYKVSKEKLGTLLRKQEDWFGNVNLTRNCMFSKNTKSTWLDIEYAVNFFDRGIENSKVNGGWQKRLNSRHLQTLMTLNVSTKVWELCHNLQERRQHNATLDGLATWTDLSVVDCENRFWTLS